VRRPAACGERVLNQSFLYHFVSLTNTAAHSFVLISVV